MPPALSSQRCRRQPLLLLLLLLLLLWVCSAACAAGPPRRRPHAAAPSCPATWQNRACEELKKVLTAEDAPAAMTLLLHDAGTYDRATKTGGCNGSVVLP